MGAGGVLAPTFAAGLGALGMAAWWLGRRAAWMPGGVAFRFVSGLLALCCLGTAASLAGSQGSLASLLLPVAGVALLALAALLALRGARLRSRAEVLRAVAPQDVDEAVAVLPRAGKPGVFRGRLGARGAVTSPAGLVCAFYESRLRAAQPDGRGMLLTRERAQAALVCLRGERHEVALRFSPSALLAPVEPRRCSTSASLASMDPRVLAGAEPVEEATSEERVGRIGEPCLVVGRLEPGLARGRYALKGLQGGPALLVLGTDAEAAAAKLARQAWGLLAGAAALTVAAAFLLSRLQG